MAESIFLSQELSKKERYRALLPQLESLLENENNLVANLANISAALKSTFNFFWVGFYLFDGKELVLGPFQGPVACTRIKVGSGVCGKAFQQAKTILVADVNQFDDHISCNAESQSEIVVPIILENKPIGVLDVDSNKLNDFDTDDKEGLESIANLISFKF